MQLAGWLFSLFLSWFEVGTFLRGILFYRYWWKGRQGKARQGALFELSWKWSTWRGLTDSLRISRSQHKQDHRSTTTLQKNRERELTSGSCSKRAQLEPWTLKLEAWSPGRFGGKFYSPSFTTSVSQWWTTGIIERSSSGILNLNLPQCLFFLFRYWVSYSNRKCRSPSAAASRCPKFSLNVELNHWHGSGDCELNRDDLSPPSVISYFIHPTSYSRALAPSFSCWSSRFYSSRSIFYLFVEHQSTVLNAVPVPVPLFSLTLWWFEDLGSSWVVSCDLTEIQEELDVSTFGRSRLDRIRVR